MIIFAIVYAIIFIVSGRLAARYPTMISGISTMADYERANIDLHATGQVIKRGLMITGVLSGLFAVVFSLLRQPVIAIVALLAITFMGVIITSIISQRYNKNRSNGLSKYISTAAIMAVLICVTSSIITTSKQPDVLESDTEITFTGKYGMTINKEDITKVQLLDEIPEIKIRTNGLGLGTILKGHFILDELGACNLLLRLPNPPYLYIEYEDDTRLIFNATDPDCAKKLYRSLSEI